MEAAHRMVVVDSKRVGKYWLLKNFRNFYFELELHRTVVSTCYKY